MVIRGWGSDSGISEGELSVIGIAIIQNKSWDRNVLYMKTECHYHFRDNINEPSIKQVLEMLNILRKHFKILAASK